MFVKSISIIIGVLIVLSCDSDKQIRTYTLPKPQPVTKETQAPIADKKSSELTWETPEGWIPTTGSSMRLVSFDIPFKGSAGDLSVIQLGGSGGGLEANVNRWRVQLDLPVQSLAEIENELTKKNGKLGEFQLIRIVNFQSQSAFLCAIIPAGDQTLFVKLSTIPDGIKFIEPDFISFCSSLFFSI